MTQQHPEMTDRDCWEDLQGLYGRQLEGLKRKEKRHLMFMACAALIFRWSYVMRCLPGYSVPTEALAICCNLSPDGLLLLINALSASLRIRTAKVVAFPVFPK
jgi:hypothetical protein